MNVTSELIWQDTQHQMLFRLIADLKREPFDPSVLLQLQQYADHHFCLEEAYMTALQYPAMQAHLNAHNRFREELRQLAQLPSSLGTKERASLSLFLEEWLTRHIFGIDKDFEQFVLNSAAK